jgi:hypothetical protein
VAVLGSGGIYIGFEERKDEGVGQSETRNISHGSHVNVLEDVKIK